MVCETVGEFSQTAHQRGSVGSGTASVERVFLAAPERLHAAPDAGCLETREEHRVQRSTQYVVAIREPRDVEARREPRSQLAMRVRVLVVLGVAVNVLVQKTKKSVSTRSTFHRHETNERASRTKHPPDLVEGGLDAVNVLEHVAGYDRVEGIRFER